MNKKTFLLSLKTQKKDGELREQEQGESRMEDAVAFFADLFFDCMAQNIRHTECNSDE